MRQCWAKCQFRKNCVTPSYQYRFTPGRYRLVSGQRSGEKLDLGILPSRSPSASALWCVLSGDPSLGYTVISSRDLMHVLFRKQHTAPRGRTAR